MGYRSDVKYVMLFDTEDERTKAIAKATLTYADLDFGQEILDRFELVTNKHHSEFAYRIEVHYDYVKWYDEDPWVKAQMKFLKEELNDYPHCGFAFMRLGEDDDDKETHASEEVYVTDHFAYTRISDFC